MPAKHYQSTLSWTAINFGQCFRGLVVPSPGLLDCLKFDSRLCLWYTRTMRLLFRLFHPHLRQSRYFGAGLPLNFIY